MTVYAAWVMDLFCGMDTLIGIFDTEEKAQQAIEIVLKQAAEARPDATPDSRFDYYWAPMDINSFNVEMLYAMIA